MLLISSAVYEDRVLPLAVVEIAVILVTFPFNAFRNGYEVIADREATLHCCHRSVAGRAWDAPLYRELTSKTRITVQWRGNTRQG